MRLQLPPAPAHALERLEAAGVPAWVVGGAVRDLLAGRAPTDWDLAAEAAPTLLCALPGVSAGEGARFGSVVLEEGDTRFELTALRTEGGYSDRRRPDWVSGPATLTQDLARRDYTVNAIAYSPCRGLADPFGGAADLANGRLVCVGEAAERFAEDPVRVLRGLRLYAGLGLRPSPALLAAMREAPLEAIAPERAGQELTRLLTEPRPAEALRLGRDVLARFLPELAAAYDYEQHTPYHAYTLWEHTLRVLEGTPPEPLLRWTALLHDLAKPLVATREPSGRAHYKGHDAAGAALAEHAASRLRLPEPLPQRIARLIALHRRPLPADEPAARRLLRELGDISPETLIALLWADQNAKLPKEQDRSPFLAAGELLSRVAAAGVPEIKTLALSGSDLLALGVPPGPALGRLLSTLLEFVTEAPERNTRERLTQELERLRADEGARSPKS